MVAYGSLDPRTQVGRLYSKLIVAIVVATSLALLVLPQSHIPADGFRGRTPIDRISE